MVFDLILVPPGDPTKVHAITVAGGDLDLCERMIAQIRSDELHNAVWQNIYAKCKKAEIDVADYVMTQFEYGVIMIGELHIVPRVHRCGGVL